VAISFLLSPDKITDRGFAQIKRPQQRDKAACDKESAGQFLLGNSFQMTLRACITLSAGFSSDSGSEEDVAEHFY
jgi:hypothetical protein